MISDDERKQKLTELFAQVLPLLTDSQDPDLKETPARVAKYWVELTQGARLSNADIAQKYGKTFPVSTRSLVEVRDIAVFSHCEHHLALMYDMSVNIRYLPNRKVLGLSKFGRIAKMCASRLQLQERLTQDIYDVLSLVLETKDIEVEIKGKHGCMTARGIQSRESFTETRVAGGIFDTGVPRI